MITRLYQVSLYHPIKNEDGTFTNILKKDFIKAKTHRGAANIFIEKHFPGSIITSSRIESSPEEKQCSFGTTASGQRIYTKYAD